MLAASDFPWGRLGVEPRFIGSDLADDLAAPHILEGMSYAPSLPAPTEGKGAR
jgi:hypothetical protein